MTVELNGTITKIFDIEQRKDFKFQRVQMQIDQDSQYPQTVEFQATEKSFDILSTLKEGFAVKATCNLRGNLWEGKCFLSLSLWKLESTGTKPTGNGVPPSNDDYDPNSNLPF